MEPKRMKSVAEWLHNTVFRDEKIRPGTARSTGQLPAMLLTARSLENGRYQSWQSRESIFMKQGKLLENYEDDYDYRGDTIRYYPTYQSLTDQELRGYFSWRTKLRRGDVQKAPLSFAFLYIYELINQIGTADPLDGYRRLENFRDTYGHLNIGILPYLKQWLADYVVYYGLDAELLSGSPQELREKSITVLEQVREQDVPAVICALRQLSGWLQRSKFYAAYPDEMNTVIVRVLRRMSDHYAARCKKTMVEQYFGCRGEIQLRLFDSAVFCDPLKRRDYEYVINGRCVCRCENGLWLAWRRADPPGSGGKLEALLKTIDSVMRREFDFHHPIQAKLDTKWILRIIQEEARALLAEKKAAEEKKLTLNFAQLTRIRQDAAAVQEKLMVDEDMDMPQERGVPEGPASQEDEPVRPLPAAESPGPQGPSLTPAEYRLLQCLLYGGDCGWVQAQGYLLSVLVDGINEKLYDVFLDTVLDDTPCLIEEYIENLKEMVSP